MATILIAVLGLIVSAISLYNSNFKKSKPGTLIGSQISIYPAPFLAKEGILWGPVGFYIPMTFFNWSPNGGSIIECRIILSNLKDPDKVFDISWTEFVEMSQEERRWVSSGVAQALPLPPNSSSTKTILFTWSKLEESLDIVSGRYNLKVLLWTMANPAPTIVENFEFTITDKLAQDFDYYLKQQSPMTIDVAIRETNRRNSVLTADQIKVIYKI